MGATQGIAGGSNEGGEIGAHLSDAADTDRQTE